MGFPVHSHGAGRLEKCVMGDAPARVASTGWHDRWRWPPGLGHLCLQHPLLILAESRVAGSPAQHSCPHPSQQPQYPGARGSQINSGLSREPSACIFPARRTLWLPVPRGRDWGRLCSHVGGAPRSRFQMALPTSLSRGQAKSPTLNVQFPHL